MQDYGGLRFICVACGHCVRSVSLAAPRTEVAVDTAAVAPSQSVFEALDVYAGLSSGKSTRENEELLVSRLWFGYDTA